MTARLTFTDTDTLSTENSHNGTTTLEKFASDLRHAAFSLLPKTESKYSDVFALLLHWKDNPLVEEAANSLEHVFVNEYGFKTKRFPIPNEACHIRLTRAILDFIDAGGDSPSHLKIIYYVGHGMLCEDWQVVWSNLTDRNDPYLKRVKWATIQSALEEASSDFLLLLDSSSVDVPKPDWGSSTIESIAANTMTRPRAAEDVGDAGDWSFTKALIDGLRDFRREILLGRIPQFTTGMLYGSILRRWRSMQDKPEARRGPVHVILAQNREYPQTLQIKPARELMNRLALQGGSGSRAESRGTPNIPASISSALQAHEVLDKMPLLRLEVCVTDKLQPQQYSTECTDLLEQWLDDIPAVAAQVKIEAIFRVPSTLLILSLPAPLYAYLPKTKDILSRGQLMSRNLLLQPESNDITGPEPNITADPCENDESERLVKTEYHQEKETKGGLSAGETLRAGAQDNAQYQSSTSVGVNAGNGAEQAREFDWDICGGVPTLQYYQDIPQDDNTRFIIEDSDLEQLKNLTESMKPDPESDGQTGGVDTLRQLGRLFYHMFQESRPTDYPQAAEHLQKSIEATEKALDTAEKAQKSTSNIDAGVTYALLLKDLITLLMKKYECTRSLEVLEQAMNRAQEMVTVEVLTEPDELVDLKLLDLVVMGSMKYGHTGSSKDVEEMQLIASEAMTARQGSASTDPVIQHLFRSEEAMDSDFADFDMPFNLKAVLLDTEGISLRRKFEQTGNLTYLDKAMSKGRESVWITPLGDSDRVARLVNLITSLLRWFEVKGDQTILNEALTEAQAAVSATPVGHGDRAVTLSQLVTCHRLKFDQTHDVDALNQAIIRGGEALSAMTSDMTSEHQAAILHEIGTCLWRRFETTGDLHDIDEAIRLGKDALAIASPRFPYKSAILSNLGVSLMRKFERTDNISILNDAIDKGEQAVALITSGSSSGLTDKGLALDNLGNSLRYRFVRIGDFEDLNSAVRRGEDAVNATDDSHTEKSKRLINLASSLFARFERKGSLDDLNQAIDLAGRAVDFKSPSKTYQALKLNNLGIMFKCRFECTGKLDDLSRAIRHEELAVAFTPPNHPDRATRLINLAGALYRRFEHTKNSDDLDRAVRIGEEALGDIPPDHPQRASFLTTSATCLSARFKSKLNPDDFDRAIHRAEEAVHLTTAPPRNRIQAALQAVLLLGFAQRWNEASEITATAVRLLPQVSPRVLDQRDQQDLLGEFAGLASIAAAVALQAGRGAAEAIELLELGRGVILGLRFGTRTDLSDLIDAYPDKAKSFERLRDELDLSGSLLSSDRVPPTPRRTRHDVALEFDRTIQEIRSLPNFKKFLEPLRARELTGAASVGPIVIVNVSDHRCDALIIQHNKMWALPLPNLSYSDIQGRAKKPAAIGLLEWLWKTTARPILDELGFRNRPTGDWPRVWWIPTGLLGRLPLHAAGHHYTNSSETVLDRVVSSYSSSIKALMYARQNTMQRDLSSACHKALLVSMRQTPSASDLRCAEQEIEVLDQILPPSVLREKLSQPSSREVISGLKTCTIFHFAGHAHSHPLDPSKSCLLLNDCLKTPLTVEDLAWLKLYKESPWLSYLSACSTGESEADKLQDEAIHLVSACQLAGFPHVVGSLWEIDDVYSVLMAREVYKAIIQKGWNSESVAAGVHAAASLLRRETRGKYLGVGYAVRDEGDPSIWAAYIHVGP